MTFYTHLFTSTRGPLAKIWLAAHWERKLTKAQVSECNLEMVTEHIISPKMKIGLRTSGHLLVGVVRIYSRKANYLLADCSEALLKVKNAFRPGQTDLAVEELEAERKAITLVEDFAAFEDFTAFDAQQPDLSDIDIVDHFSLNQSRTDEITLKEDDRNEFLTLADFGESNIGHMGLLDMSLQNLSHDGDAFGDEDRRCELLDFLMNPSDDAQCDLITEEMRREKPMQMQVETPLPSESTLLTIEENGYALEPVPITPDLEKKRGKRKRKLIVDQDKQLSDAEIREQMSDFSDLVVTLDLAPPTRQLMQWKENGGAHRLFARPCSCLIAPQLIELFSICGKRGVQAEREVMRQDRREGQGDSCVLTTDISIMDSSLDIDPTLLGHMTDPLDNYSICTQMENNSALTQTDLPSEDSRLFHPSLTVVESHLSFSNTRSAEDSQVFEDGNIKTHAQKLLDILKRHHQASFSLKSLCAGVTRSQAATTFFCLLVLSKQRSLRLQQNAPFEDVLVTPGPMF